MPANVEFQPRERYHSVANKEDGNMSEKIKNLGFAYSMPPVNLQELSEPDIKRAIFRCRKVFEQIIFDTVNTEKNAS